MQLLVMGL